MKEPLVTLSLAQEMGLLPEEYRKICSILGRTPSHTEIGLYSTLWSESCSYKNSIAVLKTFPRDGNDLLVKSGQENAGMVDIGDGLAVSFNIRSYDPPSAVSGILCGLVARGARPIASLNSLRFGRLSNDREGSRIKVLFSGMVKSIGDYGNALGVPTVAGEAYFEDSYQGNPLVNVMTVGLLEHAHLASASAKEPGNVVLYVGAETGRDGIDGASERQSTVQVGDPFTEKRLMEASLEAIRSGCAVGIQDVGAAGLAFSLCEMSAKTGFGLELFLDKVPIREIEMTSYDIVLSGSPGRMLLAVKPEEVDRICAIYAKWDLPAMVIGRVTDNGRLRLFFQGETVADIPLKSLVLGGDAPVYVRERKRPAYLDKTQAFNLTALPEPTPLLKPMCYNDALLQLLAEPNIASKEWIYRQYDYQVRTNSVVTPGSDAAVVRIKGTTKGLALSVDGNGRYCYLDPRIGGRIAVAEAARNGVCSGGRPLAITYCLHFGNPYDPEIYWTFVECVTGMSEACRALNTPVTGGDVSFYNVHPDTALTPTPMVGMLALLEDVETRISQGFKEEGDRIVLLGETRDEIGGSEYLRVIYGQVAGQCPDLNLEREKALQACVLQAAQERLLQSAHDCSEGGFSVCLAESCIADKEKLLGAQVDYACGLRADRILFSESQSRVVVSVRAENLERVKAVASQHHVPLAEIGRVGGDKLRINDTIDVDVYAMCEAYYEALRRCMEG